MFVNVDPSMGQAQRTKLSMRFGVTCSTRRFGKSELMLAHSLAPAQAKAPATAPGTAPVVKGRGGKSIRKSKS